MRKFLAVFLLLVFLVNLTGIFIAFKIQKSIIRHEVMQLLQQPEYDKKLIVFAITPHNKHLFEWEHDREFRHNKMMYDIVKKETNSKGELIVHCILDKKETQLWSDLTELVKKNSSSHQAIKNLVKLFNSVFLPSAKITIDSFSDASLIHHRFSATIPFAENEIASPPPKQV